MMLEKNFDRCGNQCHRITFNPQPAIDFVSLTGVKMELMKSRFDVLGRICLSFLDHALESMHVVPAQLVSEWQ